MTTIAPTTFKCGVCGKESTGYSMTSFSRFGACDLDTRPPMLFPFTMELENCPHCGYVDVEIKNGNKALLDFLNTDKYLTCDGIDPICETAKEYIRYAIIQQHKGNRTEAFWGYMNAAWACDDFIASNTETTEVEEKYIKDMMECRGRALELIALLLPNKKEPEEKENLLAIKADLLRRTKQFDKVIEEYENRCFEDQYVDQVIRFGVDLAKAQDDKRYSMDDIDKSKYPLR